MAADASFGPIIRGDLAALEAWLAGNPPINELDESSGRAAIHVAAMDSKGAEMITLLIRHDADMNLPLRGLNTPLMLAIQSSGDRLAVIRALIAAGADLNWMSRYNRRALDEAIQKGKTEVVKLLLDAGAEADFVKVSTPLVRACMERHEEIAALLIQAGASVNRECNYGTPLSVSVAAAHTGLIELLLKHGADPNQRLSADCVEKKHAGKTCLEIASESNRTALIELLSGVRTSTMLDTLPNIWKRIERALGPNKLRDGLESAEWSTIENEIHQELPPAFKESWAAHDGQEPEGEFIPSPDGADDERYRLLPQSEIVREWLTQNTLSKSGDIHWNAAWIPFAGNGAGDFICLDLSTSDGSSGQVIWQQNESRTRRVLAPSFSHWLDDVARELQGNTA